MKKILMLLITLGLLTQLAKAQKESEEDKKPFFNKQNLFTGGSVGAGFGTGTFSFGIGPHIGYSINKYVDVALTLNYNYVSQRDQFSTYKVRQSIIGPGAYLRLYPVNFLFAQAQYEYNFVKFKEITGGGFADVITKYNVQSILVGGGYATGRDNAGQTFFYVAILFDVANNLYSPYKDRLNRAEAVFRTGIHIPLFQGSSSEGRRTRRSRDDY